MYGNDDHNIRSVRGDDTAKAVMRLLLLSILLTAGVVPASAQTPTRDTQRVWTTALVQKINGFKSVIPDLEHSVQAVVTFTIDGTGKLTEAHVAKSSGVPKVDEAALRAVQRASPFSPPPPEMTTTALTFKLPFHYIACEDLARDGPGCRGKTR